MTAPHAVQPPGTILQHMFLRERLRSRVPGTFLEVGCGTGELSQLLLSLGWRGRGLDLGASSVAKAARLNASAIESGLYATTQTDFLRDESLEPVDLIISCMVIEHLDDPDEGRYFSRCRELLRDGGLAVVLVPAGMRYWGIEDEVAGHVRRYSTQRLKELAEKHGLVTRCLQGLTFPLSNLLLPISNRLVRRSEAARLDDSMAERTVASGDRDVAFKTSFPGALRLVLNPVTLAPLHWAQKHLGQNGRSLVLYAEMAAA